MKSRIYLLTATEELVPMNESPYEAEELLQRLLAEYPDLLAGDQMDQNDPKRWVLIRREMSVPDSEASGGRWSLDHLFIDQVGVPTLVEVKRSSDTRARREVVAQMLDYAANGIAHWPIEQLQAEFEQSCARADIDPSELLQEFLREDGREEAFWQQVKTNLQAGRIRMVFVADVIPKELQRIVEFLNEQMDPAEVLAVEVRQYLGATGRVLVPRVIGQTADAEQRKSVSRVTRDWDAESMLEDLQRRKSRIAAEVATRILNWSTESGIPIDWGRGAKYGTFSVRAVADGKRVHAFNVTSEGHVEVGFSTIARLTPFDDPDRIRELLSRFNEIPGVNLPDESIDGWPRIPLEVLSQGEALAGLFSVYDWYATQF